MTASTSPSALTAASGRRILVRRLGLIGLVLAAIVVFLVAKGIAARNDDSVKLRDWTEAQAIPTVALVALNSTPGVVSLNLPGRLDAIVRAPIYARVSGYVKTRSADIGDTVKAGQILAEIEAPDLDQQLLQAKADLTSAEASARLSEVTLSRGRSLLSSAAVSQQDVDQRAADLDNKKASVQADQANVERLQALAGYEHVAAPFDGVVTERNTDVGALISAGSSAGAPMFVVSDLKKLRASINVPQNYVPAIPMGTVAAVTVPEYPNRKFEGVVEATARSVDAASGATLMQLGIDNSQGALMPGAYANVHLDLKGAAGAFQIPVSALIFDQRGLRVATVDGQNRVKLKTVTIARDLGAAIEIGSGLAADDRVIASPADGIADGDEVRIAEPPPPPKS
jgi:membrane fusion protein (multidrug efflux system)